MAGPLNYTTSIDAEKSAYECLALLGRYGASRIGLAYGKDKVPVGLTFTIETKWGLRPYEVDVDSASTLKVLQEYTRSGRIRSGYANQRQAERVAWRVIKDWLESQLALIEAGLMTVERVLSAHMLVQPGKTMLDIYDENQPAIGR